MTIENEPRRERRLLILTPRKLDDPNPGPRGGSREPESPPPLRRVSNPLRDVEMAYLMADTTDGILRGGVPRLSFERDVARLRTEDFRW